ncbi:MAG: protein kinase [Deltaproteobacteria bacterium]|nr:protein kinase [Deltaproteobacteria bacterium]
MVKGADSSDPAPASSSDPSDGDGEAAKDEQRPSTTGVRPLGSTRQKGQRDSVPMLPPRPGIMTPERVVGRCEIFAPIAGGGGLASVYVGRLIGVGGFARTVAVKLLHEQYAKDPAFRQMFLDEAHVVSRIRHPNVVPTLDLVDEGDELFIVMEYVEGDTLDHLMQRPRKKGIERPPVGVALSIVSETLHGLHAAHEARDAQNEPMNLVHRDVTPHNILVGTDGYARLMDFGIAHALGQARSTRAGEVKGDPGFLAPEQVQGESLDRRADVFSASVVLWHALTGQQLFKGTTPVDLAKEVLEGDIDPPSKHADGISPQLDEIVLRGLERDPDKRWPSAAIMAEAIETLKLNAAHREVGAWVRKAAHQELSRRSALIAGLERAPIDNEGMEQKSDLPVYRMPAKDASGAIIPAPAAEEEGPVSESTFDDDDPLEEASLVDTHDEPVEDEAGLEKAAHDEPETRKEAKQGTDKRGRAPSAAKPAKARAGAAEPPRPNRRQLLILAGAAVGIGGIVALATLTGGDGGPESRSERPAPSGQATLPQTPAPTDSSPAPKVSSVEPVRSAPTPTTDGSAEAVPSVSPSASAAPAESASASPDGSASAAPISAPPTTVITEPPPDPTGTSLYGRE